MKSKFKNFSIVMAVYNGEDTIEEAIESILNLEYPKSHFELVIVDDGSTDNTILILDRLKQEAQKKGLNFELIKNSKNLGRIKSRLKGFLEAKFDRVLILDVRSFIAPDALTNASDYANDTNIICNYYMEKTRSIDDRVLYLFRKKYYKPYWGKDFQQVEITKTNFNKIPKGTGGFITNKETFIKVSKTLEGRKEESDDTKIFYKYIENGEKITRVPDVRILYKNRTGIMSLKHIFQRGPRFVDFYFQANSKLVYLFSSLHLVTAGIIATSLFVSPLFLLVSAGLGILFLITIAVFLSENFIDFVSVIFYLPVIIVVFYLGILKGLYIKYLK